MAADLEHYRDGCGAGMTLGWMSIAEVRWSVLLIVVGLLLCGIGTSSHAQPTQRALSAQLIAQVDSLANAQLAIDGVGGMTIGVVGDGGLIWTNSYGYADMARRVPASRSTVYRVGSITKQFTALMLQQLADRGVVQLSAPVDRYWPAFDAIASHDARARRVTLLELATMTSGLAQEPDPEERYTVGRLEDWEHTLIAALPHTTFHAEPGVAWEYSNIGYAALGAALQHAAHASYLEYIPDHILRPLGMTHSGFRLDSAARALLATGYAMGQGIVDTVAPRRELAGRGYKVPNGGLFSTVDDLAAFMHFEMGFGPDAVLSRASVARHFAKLDYATNDLTSGYGLGFHAIRRGSLVALGHPGSVAGYLSAAYFDPVSHTGVIVLRNVDDAHFDVLNVCLRVLELAASAPR
ncbi:MAG TPA: serine hydrolase domain-containing protein [Gemmatimonadaceae bacterium]|nr:serine hydrolase domain-containing protein [Gemmatimonadaceae bacterium]